jgi:hypothetical protein
VAAAARCAQALVVQHGIERLASRVIDQLIGTSRVERNDDLRRLDVLIRLPHNEIGVSSARRDAFELSPADHSLNSRPALVPSHGHGVPQVVHTWPRITRLPDRLVQAVAERARGLLAVQLRKPVGDGLDCLGMGDRPLAQQLRLLVGKDTYLTASSGIELIAR